MSFAQSMRLLWAPGLTDCTGARSWTTDKLFRAQVVTATSATANNFQLYVGNAQNSHRYFAHEADRFASAAFESVLSGSRWAKNPRSTGWLLIRTYYAAFFSLHALMRLQGEACARLTAAHLNGINNDLKITAPGSRRFEGGLYHVVSENGGRELRCTPMGAAAGGTHEALWSLFAPYFRAVNTTILSQGDPSLQSVVAAIDTFTALVDGYGGGKWFTTVRNRVNYAHDYGAWFPYTKSSSDYDRIESVLSKWVNPPDETIRLTNADELIHFTGACAFLVSLCSVTIRDLHHRSRAQSPFRQSSGLLIGA
jgi:hypothetical protein